jgi:hypothetical protein
MPATCWAWGCAKVLPVHYVNGKKGVRDFDVPFYAQHVSCGRHLGPGLMACWFADSMACSALLVAFLVLPAASAERSLGDPAGEPALHRPNPVKGLVTQTPGHIDALCSCLKHLVPDL